jgi:hypothetical protein
MYVYSVTAFAYLSPLFRWLLPSNLNIKICDRHVIILQSITILTPKTAGLSEIYFRVSLKVIEATVS